ncbi:MAG: hypothetical protein K8T89_03560 [Planctomycetes bacterium]|nr:hypothetical protein [Planctomycetota bacterium]
MVGLVLTSRQMMVILLLAALLFGIAHTQAPLYYSNQHQYFLHGSAAGGLGFLDRDWLANTLDPTPVFSGMVAFTQRFLHPWLFHAIHLLLMMIYFASLMVIGGTLIPSRQTRPFRLFALGCLLIVIHAGIVRLVSIRLAGIDYPWYLQTGVANQYILGPGLQPSAFGVLLLASVAAFVKGRTVLAVLFSSGACCLHATYLLPAAMLTIVYMVELYRDGRARTAIQLGIGSLLTVLPVVLHTAVTFYPTSSDLYARSQDLLANVRIPHHSLVRRWLDPIAIGQLLWIGAAIMLVRKTKLFLFCAIPAAIAVGLTLIQVATDSLSLALLFPWRISVVLMPIATCVILARLVFLLSEKRWFWVGGVACVTTVVAFGVVIQLGGWAYPSDEREIPALQAIRASKEPGDVYLIPVRVPAVGSGPRGAVSLSFAPPPTNKDKHHIAVDLQRFRLFTGAPIYVDFKSIPYKDRELVEWRRRLQMVEDWYAKADWSNPVIRAELKHEGITHVVIPTDKKKPGEGFREVYHDEVYHIYRID